MFLTKILECVQLESQKTKNYQKVLLIELMKI